MILFADFKKMYEDFPGGPVIKNQPYTAGDMGSTTDCRRATKASSHNYGTCMPELDHPPATAEGLTHVTR